MLSNNSKYVLEQIAGTKVYIFVGAYFLAKKSPNRCLLMCSAIEYEGIITNMWSWKDRLNSSKGKQTHTHKHLCLLIRVKAPCTTARAETGHWHHN